MCLHLWLTLQISIYLSIYLSSFNHYRLLVFAGNILNTYHWITRLQNVTCAENKCRHDKTLILNSVKLSWIRVKQHSGYQDSCKTLSQTETKTSQMISGRSCLTRRFLATTPPSPEGGNKDGNKNDNVRATGRFVSAKSIIFKIATPVSIPAE